MQPRIVHAELIPHPFDLSPKAISEQEVFQKNDLCVKIRITRQKGILSLEYLCVGRTDSLAIPAPKENPLRTDHLWEHTCFEAFLTWDKLEAYWELNYSPSGDWNVYHFDSYRKNQKVEGRIQRIAFSQSTSSSENSGERPMGSSRLSDGLGGSSGLSGLSERSDQVTLDLSPILPRGTEIELSLGITAVIEKRDQSKTYWALTHLAERPDFHLRDSFILKI